ncbi:hypothetical protein [Salinibacterium sp. ZJ77]|uniref:hypothetical protein n=1 Tax=Salinibacterium sp. ZJ77 TaxID=2708337 RepID=UPI00141F3708|nr:hypothetical protein [Salinibacterium sp. ZJ77]
MKTTVTVEPRLPDTIHDTTINPATHPPVRRLSMLDRAALHLGVALIRWGRRPHRALARYERRANDDERRLALAHEAAVTAYEDARTRAFLGTIR